jgi:hypothetical protein
LDISSLSSLGASGTQAIGLNPLPGTPDVDSGHDSLPGASALGDSMSLSAKGQALSSSSVSNSFMTDFNNLGGMLQSNDLAGAGKLYQKLQTGLPGSSPAAADLSSLGSALGTGDGSSALKAWQAAQTDLGSHGASAGADQATGGQLLAAYVKNAGLS